MRCAGVEGIPEYLAVAGPESFTPVLTAALKGYSKSVVRWVPTQESIYSGRLLRLILLTCLSHFCDLCAALFNRAVCKNARFALSLSNTVSSGLYEESIVGFTAKWDD